MAQCEERVEVGARRDGSPILTRCGNTAPDGSVAYCDVCEAKLEKRYPQGWVHTPGDLCKHGTYVGDSWGADYMCLYCEMGE